MPPSLKSSSQFIWPRVSWGIFLLLFILLILVASGAPTGSGFLLGALVAILLAWRYPYFSFYVSLATAPLLGIMVSISTGQLVLGERAFGGSIDVFLGELIAAAVLVAWALRVLILWRGRRDWNWKPWLPLGVSFSILVGAHLLSVFSPASPDPLTVIKYSLRPVLLAYVLSVVLTVNYIRSRRRLIASLIVLSVVGLLFALDGLRSLFFSNGVLGGLHRARPLPILGVSPIGENHNVLAEFLLFTAPLALAFGALARDTRSRFSAYAAAAFMTAIALLTFARSAWITVFVELSILGFTIWRPWLRRHLRKVVGLFVLCLPLIGYMMIFSLRPEVASSTDARATLSGIAWELFQGSPWIGVGAGTFTERVSQTYVYLVEFGTPLDSHGVVQKLLAETGVIGLGAFLLVLVALARQWFAFWPVIRLRRAETFAYLYLTTAVVGAFTYQLFNTTYWSAKLWLPVGIALAAGRVLARRASRDADFLVDRHV